MTVGVTAGVTAGVQMGVTVGVPVGVTVDDVTPSDGDADPGLKEARAGRDVDGGDRGQRVRWLVSIPRTLGLLVPTAAQGSP